jgi:branched-chain amino acid transport system permease protein
MKKYWWLGLIFIGALILPLVVGEFWVHVAVEILILGLFAVSFNMIFGYMGQLSFGHAAYYGVGAYATGMLLVKASIPLPICLVASMIAAGICALIFGYFCGMTAFKGLSPQISSLEPPSTIISLWVL